MGRLRQDDPVREMIGRGLPLRPEAWHLEGDESTRRHRVGRPEDDLDGR